MMTTTPEDLIASNASFNARETIMDAELLSNYVFSIHADPLLTLI